MFSVLIVDDEILSRLGLVNLVDWKGLDFYIVDHVSNGEEALSVLSKNEVDLIITDIKMPVKNGIDLIQDVKHKNINSEFIVLSSYDDYEYVRVAMKLGAFDYLLKLDMTKDSIEGLLTKVKNKINNKKQINNSNIIKDSQVISNARSEFLKQMMFGRLDTGNIREAVLNKNGIHLPYNNFAIIMFKISNLPSVVGEKGVRQVVNGALSDNKYSYITGTGINEFCILCNFSDISESNLIGRIRSLGQRIIFILKQYFNQEVKLYISPFHHLLKDIPLLYLEVNQTYSLRNLASDEQFVFYEEIQKRRDFVDYQSLEKYLREFELALNSRQSDTFRTTTNEFIDFFKGSKYIDLTKCRYVITSLIYISNRFISNLGYNQEKIWDDENKEKLLVDGLNRKEDFIRFLTNLQWQLLELLDNLEDNHIVRLVKHYVDEHYLENIVIKDLTRRFGVTSNYLSTLFKQATDCSLKEYIISKKMSKAKELLKETNLQINEVAEGIGYDNEHYFSRIFKQKVGLTPSQYRNAKHIK